MKKIFLIGIMLCTLAGMYAQSILSGMVADENGRPLPGATIYINETNKGTVSDETGAYLLNNLPKGKTKVQYSYMGYASQVKTIYLNDGNNTLNVILQETMLQAEEVVVSGGYNSTQHENAVKIDVLKMNLPEQKTTPNVMELIAQLPGVDMISKGSGVTKPVIRGLSMNDVLTLNNGVRIENYQYSSHHPLGLDEFGIENVEVIKGPASLLYGSDAIGGVVNFIPEKPAPVDTWMGDYNLQLFSNSMGISNNVGVKGVSKNFFGGIRFGHKSHADYLQGGGQFVPNTRFNEYSLKLNAGHTGQKGLFHLFYDYNRHNIGLVEEHAMEELNKRGRKPDIFYQKLNNHLLSSRNVVYINNIKLEVNGAYQSTELAHLGEKNQYEVQMRLGTLTYESRLYLPSDLNSEYIIGFQGMNQQNTNLHDRETKLLPNASIGNYSLFTLLQRTLAGKIKLQGGLRYDYKHLSTQKVGEEKQEAYRPALSKTYGSISGSLGATFTVNEALLLRANLAAAYRTPNLAELTSNGQHEEIYEVGDVSLKPENAYEADVSLHWHKENFTLDAAAFYNYIRNYIFIAPTGEKTTQDIPVYKYRQDHARLYGAETGLHIHPLNVPWLHFQTTFSYVLGKQDNKTNLPFIPAHKWRTEARAEKKSLSFLKKAFLSASTEVAFSQNRTAPQETATPGYTLVDLGAGATLFAGKTPLSASIGVNNLFDKKYVDHLSLLKEVDMFNPGRNVVFSMRVQF